MKQITVVLGSADGDKLNSTFKLMASQHRTCIRLMSWDFRIRESRDLMYKLSLMATPTGSHYILQIERKEEARELSFGCYTVVWYL